MLLKIVVGSEICQPLDTKYSFSKYVWKNSSDFDGIYFVHSYSRVFDFDLPFEESEQNMNYPIILEVAKPQKGQKYMLVRLKGKDHSRLYYFEIKKEFRVSLNNSRHGDQSIHHYFSYLILGNVGVVENGMTIFHSCGKQKNLANNFEFNIASFLVSINLDLMRSEDAYKAFENSSKSVVPLEINGTRISTFSCNDLFSYLQNCKKLVPSQKGNVTFMMKLVFSLICIGLLTAVMTTIYCTRDE